ncbi:AraC family transcriptional regulator [Actinoplanes sichuanensis]|uniref:Helix-turn-helix domain-containing protein n=1 Tax=Actinoplanes sichuanensis TaxID=512349 RepID=A0ABW4AAU6_9ACTN|nr:AraC family transcriptional regulator [Actinoplanes sichuanensis]BEL05370.1 AraC family transcriptional regulator [Actinoplanes sichuanensis]
MTFAVGIGYAVYRGPSESGGPHRHAAFQIAIAMHGDVVMADEAGVLHRAPVLLVPPMTPHRLFAVKDLLTYFVEPHAAFADRLRRRGGGITAAPDLHNLRVYDLSTAPSSGVDPRLVRALEILRDGDVRIPEVARRVGISPQRLRALARQQVGMPLPRWRVWMRLARAAEAMPAGQSAAVAAVTAGFADQAHLTRQIREMMGLTPAVAMAALRSPPRPAT